MFSLSLFLVLFALSVRGQVSHKWEFYAYGEIPGAIGYGRLDPIVSPGQVSEHVHMVHGGSAMGATYDYDILREQATCSSVQVQQDLSNYWAPAMYHYDGVGNFSLLTTKFNVYYQFATYSYDPNNKSGSAARYPFPKGLTMLAGDMFQRSINHSDPNSYASIFQCMRSAPGNPGSPYSHDIRDFQKEGWNCDADLRGTTRFPSCFNGNTTFSQTNPNVVYPDGNGVCPSTHPQAFIQMTFEWYFPVGDYPFDPSREDNWVLSFGDTSGLGFHGDFANGWDVDLMAEAISQCNTTESAIENCPPFAEYNDTPVPPCMATGLWPDEPVGLNGVSLTALPGCNLLWTDNSTKPTCEVTPAPAIDTMLGPDLSEWNYVNCTNYYQKEGPLLTNLTKTGWEGMTVDSCLAQCKGYKYAMVEWTKNCYCDNELQNGGTSLTSTNLPCQARCETDYSQLCGGYGSGQLYEACQGNDCHQNSAPARFSLSGTTATLSATTTPSLASAQSTSTTASYSSATTPTLASAQSTSTTASYSFVTTTTATPTLASAQSTSTPASCSLATPAPSFIRCNKPVTPADETSMIVVTNNLTTEQCASSCFTTSGCTSFTIASGGQCSLFSKTIAAVGGVSATGLAYYNVHCFTCS